MTEEPQTAGYRQPPRSSRFRKGQSGNPRGRPKNRHREIPYGAVLGQMVTIREDGRERRVTAAEAFLLQLTQKGVAGDSAATRASLEAIEVARAKTAVTTQGPSKIIMKSIGRAVDAIFETLEGWLLKADILWAIPANENEDDLSTIRPGRLKQSSLELRREDLPKATIQSETNLGDAFFLDGERHASRSV